MEDYSNNRALNPLVVKIIIVASIAERVASTTIAAALNATLGELEEGTGAGVLHLLGEGLIATDLDITDGATSHRHSLLEMTLGELGDGVLNLILHLDILASSLALLGTLDVGGDGLLNGNLDSTLGDEAKIGTGEAMGLGGDVVQVDIGSDRGLAELSLENAETASLIGKGNVDEGVETAGTAERGIELLGTVGSTDNEDVLLGGHTVHFCGQS